jgi:hypothetical protein
MKNKKLRKNNSKRNKKIIMRKRCRKITIGKKGMGKKKEKK